MEQPNMTKGDKVAFSTRDRQALTGTFSHWTKAGEAYIKGEDGKTYWKKPGKFKKIGEAETNFEIKNPNGVVKQQTVNEKFDVNQRFEFLASLVKMTATGKIVSMVVTGEGGLGKTFTVLKVLDELGLKKANLVHKEEEEKPIKRMMAGMGEVMDSGEEDWKYEGDYLVVKGYSTAKGLYNTLYQNLDKLIVFDDCDEVLKNDVSKMLLKGALDSYDKREIHWVTNQTVGDIPPSFEFKGRIIFISNMNRDSIHQAILSRTTSVDLTMSIEDKLERMKNILPRMMVKVDMKKKEQALALLEQYKNQCSDLNMRTLIKVIQIVDSGESNWKELAEYMILS